MSRSSRFLVWSASTTRSTTCARAKIASGFGFWDNTAGFDISQTLIAYSTTSTYGRAFWVGLLNTLLVAVHRHRPRDDPRLHRRHRAAVDELAGGAARRRSMSRSSATCRCCCSCCSGTTPCSRRCRSVRDSARAAGRRASSTSAACSCRSRCSSERLRLVRCRARRRHRRRDRVSRLGASAGRCATGQQFAGALGHARRS